MLLFNLEYFGPCNCTRNAFGSNCLGQVVCHYVFCIDLLHADQAFIGYLQLSTDLNVYMLAPQKEPHWSTFWHTFALVLSWAICVALWFIHGSFNTCFSQTTILQPAASLVISASTELNALLLQLTKGMYDCDSIWNDCTSVTSPILFVL